MGFGKEIKRLRKDANISAQKLANLIGIDAERLRKWEQKDLDPRHSDTMIIERFFSLPLNEIEKLTSIKKFLKVPNDLINDTLLREPLKLVPYYDIDVTAGNMEIFTGENKEFIHSMVRVPAMSDVDAFVNVSGDSMYDAYCSGDIIGIKKIAHENFIEWGEAHVVITRDDRRLLKYVRRADNKKFIILRSENRENNDDIDLPVNLVVSMFIVKGLIRRKTM